MTQTLKAMIIVHGMGTQGRNSALLGTVRPMLELMRKRGEAEKTSSIDLEGALSSGTPASVDLTYGDQTWRIIEYWWAEEFQPPRTNRVAVWILRRLSEHLKSWISAINHSWRDLFSPEDPSSPRDPIISRIYQLIASPIFIFGIAALYALVPLLTFLMAKLPLVRSIPGVPSLVGRFSEVLQTIGVDFLGDIYVYFYDEVQSPQLRGGLERLLKELGRDQSVKDVVLYAHSTGAIIAYDAIANLHESKELDSEKAVEKVRSFITFGSIMNMAWNPHIVRHNWFKKSIPSTIRWFNLWTRYDPGPAGPIETDGKPWLQDGLPANRRVNNFESILLDHTGYWNNCEQVVSLAMEELGGPDDGNDFWRGPGQRQNFWGSRSEQAWKDFDARRGTVAWLAFSRLLLFWILTPLAFILMLVFYSWAQGIGRFLQLHRIPWDKLSWFTDGLTSDPTAVASIAVPVVIAVLLTAGAFILYLLYKRLWWKPWANRVCNRRHREFKQWRATRRSQQQQA